MKQQFLRLAILVSAIACMGGCSSSSSSPVLATEPVKVYISGVTATPLSNEVIVVRNNSGAAVDISRWTLTNASSSSSYSVPDGIVLGQGKSQIFPHSLLGFQIADSNETISLKDNSGAVVDSWTN